jgi:hypothetical protein
MFAFLERQPMSTTLVVFGIVAVGAAIVGGGLSAFGVNIPALQSTTRQVLLAIVGVVSIAIGEAEHIPQIIGLFQTTKPADGPTTPQTTDRLADAPAPDSNLYHRLSTEFRGQNRALDVFNGGPNKNMTHLTALQDTPGQYWRFQPNQDGSYRVTNKLRGPDTCLDVFNGGSNDGQPYLVKCSNASGQGWKLKSDGTWIRFTTLFRGPGICLDIINDGSNNDQPYLAPCAAFSGQFWLLSRTDKQAN